MPPSATATVAFPAVGPLPLSVDFLRGRLNSDGGLPWLAQAAAALGLTDALAAAMPDWRRRRGRHALPTLVALRIYQIACGSEDQNDATMLRTDPLLKQVCGRLPVTGTDLASQPTLSRLENAVSARTCYRLAVALGQVYLRERERTGVLTHLVLDPDGTDDPTHEEQEHSAYHGSYGQHIYHPLVVFDGTTAQLITAALRLGTVHASHTGVAILKRIVAAIPPLYAWCGAKRIGYTIGLVTNARLERAVADLQTDAETQSEARDGAKARLLLETRNQADSWPHIPHVVVNAEVLAKGTNTRFVVTTQPTRRRRFMTGMSMGGRWRTGSRISRSAASLTDCRATASGRISSVCCCMRRRTGCSTRCAAGCSPPAWPG